MVIPVKKVLGYVIFLKGEEKSFLALKCFWKSVSSREISRSPRAWQLKEGSQMSQDQSKALGLISGKKTKVSEDLRFSIQAQSSAFTVF